MRVALPDVPYWHLVDLRQIRRLVCVCHLAGYAPTSRALAIFVLF